jgi:hypothetical protein
MRTIIGLISLPFVLIGTVVGWFVGMFFAGVTVGFTAAMARIKESKR